MKGDMFIIFFLSSPNTCESSEHLEDSLLSAPVASGCHGHMQLMHRLGQTRVTVCIPLQYSPGKMTSLLRVHDNLGQR